MMMKSGPPIILAAAFASMSAAAQTPVAADPVRRQLDVLVGDWTLTDDAGATGHSQVVAEAPGAMLFERREIGQDGALPLWFAFSERSHGWVQLFPGPNGIREFALLSEPGRWPLLFGGEVILQDGSAARFRLTMAQPDADHGERRLEISRDAGTSWQPVFTYSYRRATPSIRSETNR